MFIMSVGEFSAVYKNIQNCNSVIGIQGKVRSVNKQNITLNSDCFLDLRIASNCDAVKLAYCNDDANIRTNRRNSKGMEETSKK